MASAFLPVVKKWGRMFQGTSVLHMEQGLGKYFEKGAIKGYYSDLRHKVRGKIDEKGIPYNITNYGTRVYFCIAIFQYGLGCYDLYLETQTPEYLERFRKTADWALEHQEPGGSWDAFSFAEDSAPYSSMAQSEGASLLLRAHREFGDAEYLTGAQKAIDFMLTPVAQGGTAEYKDGCLTLLEYTDKGLILNGWIFSIWGLYEYTLAVPDKKYQQLLTNTVDALEKMLPMFDYRYWSNYDLDHHITSPFYHSLHIAQLKVMYQLFDKKIFDFYAEKWNSYRSKRWNQYRAIFKKGFQKIGSVKHSIILVE